MSWPWIVFVPLRSVHKLFLLTISPCGCVSRSWSRGGRDGICLWTDCKKKKNNPPQKTTWPAWIRRATPWLWILASASWEISLSRSYLRYWAQRARTSSSTIGKYYYKAPYCRFTVFTCGSNVTSVCVCEMEAESMDATLTGPHRFVGMRNCSTMKPGRWFL